ncbi:2-phospho-L-lactate guanylyltransferase [Schumannella sp. 10F1B-5-1]|uniref:2-phospho-L-lactate guanylyltransferase n=1 Tax=Schumannella sp. 10F1B-5-1 TaxID=2590780 RepID=UPI0011304230|nr:2-phospho-L-lactate guanylyltransferase [Schumannella sp. 10F1B-5-1]TPW72301.1 2-phospho-L-lactate guanylyltransferase [Schumannella sp. 10F1B-5-1]
MQWQVIVPVKPAVQAKTRLGADARLARAIALDTIAAALETPEVDRVTVVTGDVRLAAELTEGSDATPDRVTVIPEAEATGIAAAIALALDQIDEDSPRAVLLGDLPALSPADLGTALRAAERVERSFVPDRDTGGTTLVTAGPGVELLSRFGDGSAVRHAALGLVRLHVPRDSTLRRDVDTPDQLDAAAALGLGVRTRQALQNPES